MTKRKIEIGDRIVFKAATRASYREVTRLVNGFHDLEETMPTVHYEGWLNFAVRPREIKKVIKNKGVT